VQCSLVERRIQRICDGMDGRIQRMYDGMGDMIQRIYMMVWPIRSKRRKWQKAVSECTDLG
jgi:hypothetical protein